MSVKTVAGIYWFPSYCRSPDARPAVPEAIQSGTTCSFKELFKTIVGGTMDELDSLNYHPYPRVSSTFVGDRYTYMKLIEQ